MKTFPLVSHLIVILIVTTLFGVIYASVQQSYRTGANDSQVQLATDINARLQQGKSIDNFFADTIDISKGLSSFVVLYDATGKPLRSSGYLDGKMPELPRGVFDFVKPDNEHRVTWQPRSKVRIAMVIVSCNASSVGFVAAGRSLKEVEKRAHNLTMTIFFGWIICVGLVLLHAVLQFYYKNKNL